MINFKEEIEKYEQLLQVDEIEESINTDEMQDIFDMLQHIVKENHVLEDNDSQLTLEDQ